MGLARLGDWPRGQCVGDTGWCLSSHTEESDNQALDEEYTEPMGAYVP